MDASLATGGYGPAETSVAMLNARIRRMIAGDRPGPLGLYPKGAPHGFLKYLEVPREHRTKNGWNIAAEDRYIGVVYVGTMVSLERRADLANNPARTIKLIVKYPY
jgi:hypothetical protein